MSETNSPVLNLQNDVMQSDCDIVNVLRKAHAIAAKLNLNNFDSWIINELYGYTSEENIPRYRHVRGQLKAIGQFRKLNDVEIYDAEIERKLIDHKVIERDLTCSISELISFLRTDRDCLILVCSGEIQSFLKETFEHPFWYHFALHISRTSIDALIDIVKTTVLDWTVSLEKENILGDGMKFTPKEKKAASSMPQTININIGEGATVGQVIAGNNNQANFNYEGLAKAMSDVESAIEKDSCLSEDNKESARELLADIKSDIEKHEPTAIQASMKALKDFLIGTGSCVAAGLILAKIQEMF